MTWIRNTWFQSGQAGSPLSGKSPASMLLSVLPSAVQRRIVSLPSDRENTGIPNVKSEKIGRPNSEAIGIHGQWSQRLEVGFIDEASVRSTRGLSRASSSQPSVDVPPSNNNACGCAESRECIYATDGRVSSPRKPFDFAKHFG